jgi:hypothetical protein
MDKENVRERKRKSSLSSFSSMSSFDESPLNADIEIRDQIIGQVNLFLLFKKLILAVRVALIQMIRSERL